MLTYDIKKSSKSFIRAEPKPAAPSLPASLPINPSPSQTLLSCYGSHTQRIAPCSPLFKSYSCLFSLTLVPFPVLTTPLVLATNVHIPPKLGTHPRVKAGNLQSTKVYWEDPATHCNGTLLRPARFSFYDWQTLSPNARRLPSFLCTPKCRTSSLFWCQQSQHAWGTCLSTYPNQPTRERPKVIQIEDNPQNT